MANYIHVWCAEWTCACLYASLLLDATRAAVTPLLLRFVSKPGCTVLHLLSTHPLSSYTAIPVQCAIYSCTHCAGKVSYTLHRTLYVCIQFLSLWSEVFHSKAFPSFINCVCTRPIKLYSLILWHMASYFIIALQ